ncbi:hypothetical protein, partial [Armatimonas sp.]|uniref:hypothetical protein n=1 Tax=Armatimonas sp. TaxID=1872638 RepID=UPI00375055ED
LVLGGRRPQTDAEEKTVLSFKTPDAWRGSDPAIHPEYQGVTFDRSDREARLLGAGDSLVDTALAQALLRDVVVAAVPREILPESLIVFRIYSRESIEVGGPQPVTVGVVLGAESVIITDSTLLKRLNELPLRRISLSRPSEAPTASAWEIVQQAEMFLQKQVSEHLFQHRFRYPAVGLIAALIPTS